MKAAAFTTSASFVRRYSTVLLLLVLLASVSALVFGQKRAGTETSPYEPLIVDAARRYRLDLYIFRALIRHESSNKPGVVSPKGAMGLTQLMPATAQRFGVQSPFNPAQNIEGGARYLRWLLDKFGGDYTLALAGYNAGEGAVLKYGRRVPPYPETQSYVVNIQKTALLYRASASVPVPSISLAVARHGQTRQMSVESAEGTEGSVQTTPLPIKTETTSRYFWQ
jgi:soluble lytic murein transglycosylase-like protein